MRIPEMPQGGRVYDWVKKGGIGILAAGGLFAALNWGLTFTHTNPVIEVRGDGNVVTIAKDVGPDLLRYCEMGNTHGAPGRPTPYGTLSLVLQNAAAQVEIEWKGVGESAAFREFGNEAQSYLSPAAKACLLKKTNGVVGAPARPLAQ